MLDFYKTSGGRRLCDSTLPDIGRQLKRLADEMRRANTLKEIELGIRKMSPADVAKEFITGENPVTPEAFVLELLESLDGGESITVKKAPGAGGDRDYTMLQNQRVRGLLVVAGVKIEDDEENAEVILTQKEIK